MRLRVARFPLVRRWLYVIVIGVEMVVVGWRSRLMSPVLVVVTVHVQWFWFGHSLLCYSEVGSDRLARLWRLGCDIS